MPKDDFKDRLRKFLEEDDDGDERGSKRSGENEETTIILRGKDALAFLGIGGEEKPAEEKPTEEKPTEEKPAEETPKRQRAYFKGDEEAK
jgi:hypothetical protein